MGGQSGHRRGGLAGLVRPTSAPNSARLAVGLPMGIPGRQPIHSPGTVDSSISREMTFSLTPVQPSVYAARHENKKKRRTDDPMLDQTSRNTLARGSYPRARRARRISAPCRARSGALPQDPAEAPGTKNRGLTRRESATPLEAMP